MTDDKTTPGTLATVPGSVPKFAMVTDHCLLITDHCLLITDHWFLGHWLLGTGSPPAKTLSNTFLLKSIRPPRAPSRIHLHLPAIRRTRVAPSPGGLKKRVSLGGAKRNFA
ncbi:MAG: hypothetical protein WCO56_06115 [Verrucomicrobiota bacterium]